MTDSYMYVFPTYPPDAKIKKMNIQRKTQMCQDITGKMHLNVDRYDMGRQKI